MRAERWALGEPQRAEGKYRRGIVQGNRIDRRCDLCRAGRKRRKQVARQLSALIRMTAVQVDELTELVDVLDGVLQR